MVVNVSSGPENLADGLVAQLEDSDILFRGQNFGRDRLEVLLAQGMEDFTDSQATVRYERFANPVERTDAQVRNAHRTWSRRVGDATYDNQPRARDMVRILEMAMDLREIDPHDDI